MKNLQISEKNARKLFKTATPEFKQTLIDTFGAEYFSGNITDQVKTFEDACEVLGIDPETIMLHTDSNDTVAYKKLKVIAKALNEEWAADFDNGSQKKWYPWFNGGASGFGFSASYYVYGCAATSCGSRLCYKTEALANYAGSQFTSIYKAFLI